MLLPYFTVNADARFSPDELWNRFLPKADGPFSTFVGGVGYLTLVPVPGERVNWARVHLLPDWQVLQTIASREG